MVEIQVDFIYKGRGVHRFLAIYKQKMGPDIDSNNVNIAGRLTKQAKKNLDLTRLRPAEVGSRPNSRLTGRLSGKGGRRGAIQGNALKKGGAKQEKGVGWPRVDILDRRARHWRSLEYGTPYVTIPRGVFLRGGSTPVAPGARNRDDVFFTYKEFLRTKGLRRGTTRLSKRQTSARKRILRDENGRLLLTGSKANGPQRGAGIEAKFFLRDSWNTVAGAKGEKAFKETVDVIDRVFREFTVR